MTVSDHDLARVPAPFGGPTLEGTGRPSWRGRLHLVAVCVAVPLLVSLAATADDARSRAALIVYGVGVTSMLGVSAAYHRPTHSERSRAAWRRADHATIFAAIAGTCSALALVSMRSGLAVAVVAWSAAVGGATFKVIEFDHAHRVGGPLYVAFGWAGLVVVPAVWGQGGVLPTAFVIGGGMLYTIGAIVFARQWPTLRPATFSYHEVWHACTIVAAGLHLAAVVLLRA